MNEATDRDWYAELAVQNYKMLPGFDERQIEAGEEIFETLMPHIQKGALESIVDLGCGSGEILLNLARRLSDTRLNFGEAKSIVLVGLDPSPNLVAKAEAERKKAKFSKNVHCHFAECTSPTSLPFDQISELLKNRGRSSASISGRTALLCLGHTIFHLPYLDELFRQLENRVPFRPLVFIVDVYHSWDSTIADLESSATGAVAEPRSFTQDGNAEKMLNVLFTRWVDGHDRKHVERGLVQTRNIDADGDVVIVTRQLARTSGEMISAFSKARYFLVQKTASHSGYGEMKRFVFQQSSRSFPLPALFLDSKAVPNLKKVANAGPTAKTSPPHILARWMDESRFIEPHPNLGTPDAGRGDGFDFAVVEISPWYYSPKGFSALDVDLLICGPKSSSDGTEQNRAAAQTIATNLYEGADNQALTAALTAYRDTLAQIQARNIGAFLHPDFAGHLVKCEWARAHFSYLEGPSAEVEFSEGECEVYRRWREDLDALATNSKKADDPKSSEPLTDLHINALIEQSSVDSLTSLANNLPRDLQAYTNRMFDDYHSKFKSDRTLKHLNPETVIKDLDMVHAFLHERLRKAFGLDQGDTDIVRSVLIGIPLRILEDLYPGADTQLPERYRGGVWVFACTRGVFGPKQNTLVGDLARLSVLLANTAIEAEAANEIERLAAGDYKVLYDDPEIRNAQRTWNSAKDVITGHGFFGSRHHQLSKWKKLIDGSNIPDCSLFVVDEFKKIIEGCLGHAIENIDLFPALIFLRGRVKDRVGRYLSVDVVRRVLEIDDEIKPETNFEYGEVGYLECNTEYFSSAAQLLHAIYLLRTHKPEIIGNEASGKLIAAKLTIPKMPGEKAELVFESQFISNFWRNDARDKLWATIDQRQQRPGQKGNAACLLARLASQNADGEEDAICIDDPDSAILSLRFRFPYVKLD